MYPQLNPDQTFANPPGSTSTAAHLAHSDSTLEHSSTSSLRVQIAECYRLAPPVPPPSASTHLPTSSTPQSSTITFDYEHKILEQLCQNPPSSSAQPTTAGAIPGDPFEGAYQRCSNLNLSREDASVAFMLVSKAQNPAADAVKEAAQAYKSLKTDMGFPGPIAAGALLMCNGDLEKAAVVASDACAGQ